MSHQTFCCAIRTASHCGIATTQRFSLVTLWTLFRGLTEYSTIPTLVPQTIQRWRREATCKGNKHRETWNRCQACTMADDDVSGFHWLDYVLFTLMLVVSLGIGIYAALSGGKQKTTRYENLSFSSKYRILSLWCTSAQAHAEFLPVWKGQQSCDIHRSGKSARKQVQSHSMTTRTRFEILSLSGVISQIKIALVWTNEIGIFQNPSFCSEYLVGDRRLSLLPVTASIFMSFISAILVLGNTAEMYLHGGQAFLQTIGASAAYFITAFIVVPILYPLKLTSKFEVSLFFPKTRQTSPDKAQHLMQTLKSPQNTRFALVVHNACTTHTRTHTPTHTHASHCKLELSGW